MRREFVSFPKSGRSWLRYILAYLELDKPVHFHHDHFEFNDGSCPSHCFDFDRRIKCYSLADRVVYLERDPRDVMVSLYFQITGRFSDFFNYKGNISEFIRDDYFGAKNLHKFRLMWSEISKHFGFLKISYEDCHKDTLEITFKVLNYYGFEIDNDKVVKAVKAASFEKMKEVERKGIFPHPWLRPRNGAPKVRKGVVSGYLETLDAEDIAYLNTVFFGMPFAR